MPELLHCPKCGASLPDDAPAGLCPKCLVQAGFESAVDQDSVADPSGTDNPGGTDNPVRLPHRSPPGEPMAPDVGQAPGVGQDCPTYEPATPGVEPPVGGSDPAV